MEDFIRKNKFYINHNSLFLFGCLFYLIAPLIILQTNLFDESPGIMYWKAHRLDTKHFYTYLFLVLELIVFFYLGSYAFYKVSKPEFSKTKKLGKISGSIIFFFTSVFVGVFLFKARGSAFQGTASYTIEDNLQGILSTANLLLFYLHFVYEQPKIIKRLVLIVFIFNSIFLLGLGGRMYVIIPAVAYYVRAFNRASSEGKSLKMYVLIPICSALAASILGAIRIGDKIQLLYFIFAESIFTSYSSFSYVNYNDIPMFSMPNSFFVSFLNFIPSIFWPSKAETLTKLTGDWADFDNPLGALSIFVSVYGNFGIILGGVFIFLVGGLYGYLYKAYKTNNINMNVYYCFCGVLPFCFFRDPLAVPIKIFITSFIIIPFFISIFRKFFIKQ